MLKRQVPQIIITHYLIKEVNCKLNQNPVQPSTNKEALNDEIRHYETFWLLYISLTLKNLRQELQDNVVLIIEWGYLLRS